MQAQNSATRGAVTPGSSPTKITLRNNKGVNAQNFQLQNFNSMTPGPATTTGSKAMQILLPDEKAADIKMMTPQRGAAQAAPISGTALNSGHGTREGSAKGGLKEKRISVYANFAQKSG